MNQEELNSEFIEAAKVGDVDRVKNLLQTPTNCGSTQGADVHTKDDKALRKASRDGHTATVKVLLQAGADVHACYDYALGMAAFNGHVETVKVLLQAGADIHATDDYALRYAAYFGHTETVQALLQAGADIHVGNDYALRWAADSDQIEIVQVLLQAGANSTRLSYLKLKKFLTPRFILSLSGELITAMETSHPELKERYKYSETKSHLKSNSKEDSFDAKISLADLYYRPGGPGYYQAIAFF